MNSSARLDSAVFQLTPTRTRFDLVITVNGKKEKIASGLLNPFLSHLKAAQDQMAKGGYSIVLVPELGSDASWFTKGTVERFVRFVSTPEILERVYTIESEVLQIEEAIAIQGNNSIGMSIVEENQIKQVEVTGGKKVQQDSNEEKAIVLYKSDAQPPEANGSTKLEGNSKAQLLKVLETRKSVLLKEQGMAFARAVAAGFGIVYMAALISFAECFGASRLVDACRNFMSLWKRKHESGQWVEIEAAEATPNRADFSAIKASGIVLSNMVTPSHIELDSESNGKINSDVSADVFSTDKKPTAGHQENIQGQFPQNGFSSWPVHSPPGALPMFQPYPVQGIPYYTTYPGNSPLMQPFYSPMGHRRHSLDNSNNSESDPCNLESSKTRFQDEVDMERESSQTGEGRKKTSRSGRQKVVVRNINYIRKTERSSGSGSGSDSASETDEDKDAQESFKTSKRRGASKESFKRLSSSEKEVTDCGKDADGEQWLAFQNCLLRGVDEDRLDKSKVDHVRRRKHLAVSDPMDLTKQNIHEVQEGGAVDMHSISNGLTHMPRSSNDDFLNSRRSGQSGSGRSVDDVQSLEIDGRRRIGYKRETDDDFVVLKQESQSSSLHHSSHVAAVTGQGYSSNKLERKLFHDDDDSYIVEYRSVRVNDAENLQRNAIDMDSEFPKMHMKEEKFSNFLPDELSLIPERGAEKGSFGYNPALDYEMQAQVGGGASQDRKNEGAWAHIKPGSGSKMFDKDQKSKPNPNSSDKRKTVGPIRRGKINKLSPLDEARARAERIRNYKADLQKMKKEKDEEERKRLDALKMERQKRIAARTVSIAMKSPMPSSQLPKKQFPTKISPSSHKGSKFSDSEPGSSSPFQRFHIRTASIGSNVSSKASKTSRLSTGNHSVTNKLSLSAPSLPESEQEKGDGTTDAKASMARIRRLSEPKMRTVSQTSSVKPRSTRTISVTKAAEETESRKISAIVNHDKNMTSTLPELKIRTSKANDTAQNRSSMKERTQKLNGNKSSMNSEGTVLKKSEIGISPVDDEDDNPIIEKTVVMLECEKPCTPDINDDKSKEETGIPKRQCDNDEVTEKTEIVSSYVAVQAPVSADTETLENKSHVQPISSKVKTNNAEKEPSNSTSNHDPEETYHAPHARVSSLEDRSTRISEYGKAPPSSLETASIGVETFRARVTDSRNSTLEKIPEVVEKLQVKESSKGLRRLLKFGKKNHNSSTAGLNMESDNAGIDGSEGNEIGTKVSPNEVFTLKNLISRDETPTTSATPQKTSRSFSLLSPFRSNKEKKITWT